jgi:hypothetical protein
MKHVQLKQLRRVTLKSAVKAKPSKPSKPKRVGLSKADPEYFSKMGKISAKKRKMTSEQFSEMARLSHVNQPKTRYNGGRKPKNAAQ